MNSPIRTLARTLHLYLGLTAGTVIATCCLTGAALVFEPELTKALHPDWFHVEGSGAPIPIRAALDSVAAAVPGANVTSVTVTNDPARPWEFLTDQGKRALVDPFTGRVVALAPFRLPFFQHAMELHRWLLADDVGEWITGTATLMFVVLLLMGLILWWPRTRGALKARINPFAVFSKHGGGRRKLHDLHVALGVWCWPFLFFMAVSAMPLAFDWGGNLIMAVSGAQRPAPPPKSGGDSTAATLPLDSLLALDRTTFPNARTWSVRLPGRPSSAVGLASLAADDPSDRHTDVAYADRVTGRILRTDRWSELSGGMKVRRMVEWWHTGRAWGIPLRTLWFLAVLFGASFPLTGFLMYRAGKRVTMVEG